MFRAQLLVRKGLVPLNAARSCDSCRRFQSTSQHSRDESGPVAPVIQYVSVKESTEASSFEWIRSERQQVPNAYSPGGVPLACVIPLAFERYAKILHLFNASEDKIDPSLTQEELAILKTPDCVSIKRLVASMPKGTRILWKEAAHTLGVPYSEEITHGWFSGSLAPDRQCWPRFIDGPADGVLEEEECTELASILAKNASEHICNSRLPEIPFAGTEQPLLFEGLLEEVPKFFANYRFGPEYWWSQDHQWCVCSDYDLTFTIVGGSSKLITALLRSEVLECIEISPTIRVDDLAPMPRTPVSKLD